MVTHGFGAPFIRFYHNGEDITTKFKAIKDFKYSYDEENDDELVIRVNCEKREEPDEPWCQEGAELTASWGFIKGPTIVSRKVWIRDIKWEMGKDLLLATITCSEKGTTLKNSTEKSVYTGKTIVQIGADKANKHGLELEVDSFWDHVDLSSYKDGNLDDALKLEYYEQRNRVRIGKISKKGGPLDADPGPQRYMDRQKISPVIQDNLARQTFPIPPGSPAFNMNDLLAKFKVHDSTPQGNRSDAQYLSDLARRDSNPHTLVETRDDKLIIRRRNFTQKPYRSYEYGGTSGELIQFNPESKKKRKEGGRNGMGFSGWDALNKTSFDGTADESSDPTLAKYMPIYKYYKFLQDKGGGRLVIGRRKKLVTPTILTPDSTNLTPGTSADENDNIKKWKEEIKRNAYSTKNYTGVTNPGNTGINRVGIGTSAYRINDYVKDLGDFLDRAKAQKAQKVKDMYNGLGLNPPDAYSHANNARADAELKSNPATAQVWGDPKIQPGILITIIGVSKKYSGNYYVTKATHSIDTNNGYITDIEMVRQGHNIQTEGDMPAETTNRTVNTQVGTKDSKGNVKQLNVTTNAPNKIKTK